MDTLLKKCCEMCEAWNGEDHDYTECEECPAMRMSKENERLKNNISKIKCETSYMHNPFAIGDRREMGG